jgi:hypothetical protein
MCDYSLHNVASAPAKVGDKLVTTAFNFGTRGFSAVGDPNVAICVLPGTELAFDDDVKRDRGFGLLPRSIIPHRVARFRQVNMDQPHVHHDALEFPDGSVVLLTDLSTGQKAVVLQLPAKAAARPESGARRARAMDPIA